MNELNELRDQAYENSLIYKEKTKKIHDSKIKNRVFNVGDRVLLFNSRLKIFSGKLKTRWTGPFTVAQVFPYGTVELSQTDRPNFKIADIQQKNKNEAKRTKLSTGMESVQEIEAEGIYIFNGPTLTQPTTIHDAILRAGILTDEAISYGTLSKSNEKRKAVEETGKSGGSWRDKKKAKMGAGFVATTPPKNEFVNQYIHYPKCYYVLILSSAAEFVGCVSTVKDLAILLKIVRRHLSEQLLLMLSEWSLNRGHVMSVEAASIFEYVVLSERY
ncbi:hypothetical protein Tco_1142509 [Tanacetum coccineum]